MKTYSTLKKIILTVVVMLLIQCTQNPFSDSGDIETSHRTVKGLVQLNDHNSPENVFVWLQEYDIYTRTNGDGEFELTLPPKASQAGGSVTGLFNIFFYVVNYQLDSAAVVIRNGEFVYASADINEAGRLKLPIVLEKLVDINVLVSPDLMETCYNGLIKVNLRLTVQSKPVSIMGYYDLDETLNGIIFHGKEDQQDEFTIKKVNSARAQTKVFQPGMHSIVAYYQHDYCSFPVGLYEIVPIIWIEQEHVPEGLLAHFNQDPIELTKSYLDWPIRRNNGLLFIKSNLRVHYGTS